MFTKKKEPKEVWYHVEMRQFNPDGSLDWWDSTEYRTLEEAFEFAETVIPTIKRDADVHEYAAADKVGHIRTVEIYSK